jgi:hypothetical protein
MATGSTATAMAVKRVVASFFISYLRLLADLLRLSLRSSDAAKN